MGKEIIMFGYIKIEKHKFYQHKSPISIGDVDINKIIVSNKVPFGKKGFKYFIGYKDERKVRPLCMILPKMTAYRRDSDETKYMSFLIKDEELLEKYNEIWNKVISSIKKRI